MPVMMFAILFGLSMDYEVFLISRIREEYLKDGDTRRAVADGLAKTARVITAAAAIMVVVFLAFLAAPDVFLKLFGIGLAAAIFLDATRRADGARARRDAAARRPQLVDPELAGEDPADARRGARGARHGDGTARDGGRAALGRRAACPRPGQRVTFPGMRAPIELDLHLPNFNYPGVGPEAVFDKLVDIATTAEQAGFTSVTLMDHYHQIPPVGPPQNWMFEGNTMLAGIAARTQTIALGLLVGGVATATRRSTPRSPRRSTSSPAAARSTASAPAGSRRSTTPTASRSRR